MDYQSHPNRGGVTVALLRHRSEFAGGARVAPRNRLSLCAVLLLALLTLAGCANQPVRDVAQTQLPKPRSTEASPRPTPPLPPRSASETTTKPAIPTTRQSSTAAGAQAFATFFINSLNTGSRGRDYHSLDRLWTADCKACASMSSTLEELRVKKHHYAEDSISVAEAIAMTHTSSFSEVRLQVREVPVDVLDTQEHVVRHTNRRDSTFMMTLSFRGGRWIVTRLQPLTDGGGR